ncbi:MAG: hypothetical protein JO166_15810 [Deltaproteobacteria bacterium]|nr:hypothetical protein [Deltaproteobacteria bacterium]
MALYIEPGVLFGTARETPIDWILSYVIQLLLPLYFLAHDMIEALIEP